MVLKILLLVLCCIILCYANESSKASRNVTNLIHKRLKEIKYDKVYRPFSGNVTQGQNSQPTLVNVTLYINSFGSINVRGMEFSIEVLLRQYWNDPRLKNLVNEDRVTLTEVYHEIWTSDLYFSNSRRSKLHRITKPNFFIWLYRNGDIIYSQKISLTLSCEMNLVNFPMDVQECFIKLGSFGYDLHELRLEWTHPIQDKNVALNPSIFLNEFYNPEITTTYCEPLDEYDDNFSCLQANLKFGRKFNFYLLYTFMPSGLIVGIAWLSFFIEHEHIPGRVSLCLFALLSILTQSSATIDSLPHVSYVKAIDIWIFTCLFFVVVALTEFCMIHFFCRISAEKKGQSANIKADDEPAQIDNGAAADSPSVAQTDHFNSAKVYVKRVTGMITTKLNEGFDENYGYRVDRVFRFLFPIFFLTFNLLYWSFYWVINGIAMWS